MNRRTFWLGATSSFASALLFVVPTIRPRVHANAGDSSGNAPYSNWRQYGGSADDAQYSALKQINKTNVAQLKQVWFYGISNNGFRFGCNPIVIDGVMYVVGS